MRWMCLALMCLAVASTAYGDGMDEVNEWRRRSGMRPFVEDPAMTKFAKMKAEYRAARRCATDIKGPSLPQVGMKEPARRRRIGGG